MRPLAALVPLVTAILLSVVFWLKLWSGGGVIGGDTYTYFMPQKVWYADRLHAGEFPLWNSLSGHGYPLVAESQTGAFYPSNVVLYRVFDVNLAYSISHVGHYIATFVVAYLLARRLRLSVIGSLLASLIYTYGWFPPRASLEWANIGGLYFVWGLWCVESYLQEGQRRYLLLLSAGLGLHLLAGHYNLAFITVLTLTAYVPARLWYATEWLAASILARRGRVCGFLLASIGLGFALAAVQLWPTWELKLLSLRLTRDVGYGHIPPLYLSQTFLPWMWYAPDVDTDKAIQTLKLLSLDSPTNKTEAHLYFGLMPWLVLLAGVAARHGAETTIQGSRTRESSVRSLTTSATTASDAPVPAARRLWWLWIGLSLFGLLLATGGLLPLIQYLPGFNFFAGLGRYGLMTTLGMALVTGVVFDRVVPLIGSRSLRGAVFAIVFGLTAFDLWVVSQWVTNAFPLSDPPIQHRSESPIRRVLSQSAQPPRMFAPGPNLPTLTGFAATPQYLGLAPREYFDPRLTMPDEASDPNDRTAIEAQVAWLRRAGVTHLLRFEPLKNSAWPVRPVWRGLDPLLHPAWGRSPDEPLYLYELLGTRGRAAFADPQAGDDVRVTDYRANQVTLHSNSLQGGEVILTDLFYPGWEVSVDGQPAEPLRIEGMYRGVQVPSGTHEIVWTFRPKSVTRGLIVSMAAGIMGVLCLWFRSLMTSIVGMKTPLRPFDPAIPKGR